MSRRVRRVACVLLGWALLGAPSAGAERLSRRISDVPGMPAGLAAVAQDTTGYLWLASAEGLVRFDGYEVRPWGREGFHGVLEYASSGPEDRVLAGFELTGLVEVAGESLRVVEPPAGTASRGARHAVYARDGRLWAAWDGRLFRRDGTAWVESGPEEIARDYAWRLAPRLSGGVLVGTDGGSVWEVHGEGRDGRRLAEGLGRVSQIVDDRRGPVVAVRGSVPGLYRLGAPGPTILVRSHARPTGLAVRGDDVWASHDDGVRVARLDGSAEFLSEREGFFGAGSITVDREGGLWLTSARGLTHHPEPETKVWTVTSGLPWGGMRSIHRYSGGVLATSWPGPLRHDEHDGSWTKALPSNLTSHDRGCVDPWGELWIHAAEHRPSSPARPVLLALDGDRIRSWDAPRHGGADVRCATSTDGAFWIWSGDRLLRVDRKGAEPVVAGPGPPIAEPPAGLVLSKEGGIAVATFGGHVCRLASGVRDWSCERVPGAAEVADLVEMRSGSLWLGARGGGVFASGPDGWRRVRLDDAPELDAVAAMTPSPSGGVWVQGRAGRVHVDESPDGAAIVERLTTAHGVPTWASGHGLLEEGDGTVWLALFPGIVKVPPEARRRHASSQHVVLTSLVADGRAVPPGSAATLRHGRHGLEVRWSALSYRDPATLRYRMRLDDDEWTILTQPFVRLAGLRSGRHRIDLGAAADGHAFGDSTASIDCVVLAAWYLRPPFVAAMAGTLLLSLYVAYRLRLAQAIRLERQRTRIAMDLHDEMGSGLGSIQILADLARAESLDGAERDTLLSRIGASATDLGASLSDIVWSLRRESGGLEAFATWLGERARRLFPGGHPELSVEFPESWPRGAMTHTRRRELQKIALEALHNVSKHAAAAHVTVSLRNGAGSWVLAVEDDGVGLPAEPGSTGLGLASIRARAVTIGASVRWERPEAGGTRVEVRFDLGDSAR